MSEDPKNQETIEIEDVVEVQEETFEEDGLLPEEVALAKEHGLLKEKEEVKEEKKEETDEHEEQPEPETKEDTVEEKEEVAPTFEDVEQDEGKLKKYSPNEQALYWKWKSDKKKRQAATRERDEYRAQLELNQVKEMSYAQKLEKIKQALVSESVTVEQLQSIIGEEVKAEPKKSEEPEKDVQERISKERAERIETAEKIGNAKYPNFEELTQLAAEVVSADKAYRRVLEESFLDTEIDEMDLVEKVVSFAKLNPKYGKQLPKKEEGKKDVDRAIENSKKKISSAAVGAGNSKRTISPEDMTVEDAAKLTPEQWMKLPDSVRQRLLM